MSTDVTTCTVTAKGPAFPQVAVEAWMGDWAARSYTARTQNQMTLWQGPTSVMVFAHRNGTMAVSFGAAGSVPRLPANE